MIFIYLVPTQYQNLKAQNLCVTLGLKPLKSSEPIWNIIGRLHHTKFEETEDEVSHCFRRDVGKHYDSNHTNEGSYYACEEIGCN